MVIYAKDHDVVINLKLNDLTHLDILMIFDTNYFCLQHQPVICHLFVSQNTISNIFFKPSLCLSLYSFLHIKSSSLLRGESLTQPMSSRLMVSSVAISWFIYCLRDEFLIFLSFSKVEKNRLMWGNPRHNVVQDLEQPLCYFCILGTGEEN